MEEKLTMTVVEIDRLQVIRRVLAGDLKWREAGAELGLSERQVGRWCARVRAEGHKGIVHHLCGKRSNHRLEEGIKELAIEIVRQKPWDFGPTFACEELEAEGVKISVSSLRVAMIQAGIWRPRAKGRIERLFAMIGPSGFRIG